MSSRNLKTEASVKKAGVCSFGNMIRAFFKPGFPTGPLIQHLYSNSIFVPDSEGDVGHDPEKHSRCFYSMEMAEILDFGEQMSRVEIRP
jgi:hypothetical protein